MVAAAITCFALAHARDAPNPKLVNTESQSTITVEASREELRRQVDKFANSALTEPVGESLARWTTPICPSVMGFNREMGEYFLEKISAAAESVGAPLDKKECRGNLFLLAAADPQTILRKWLKKDLTLFGGASSLLINQFLSRTEPVRAWYNITNATTDGSSDNRTMAGERTAINGAPGFNGVLNNERAQASRLKHNVVRTFESVIVVIDTARIDHLTFGQIAGYAILSGFAQLRLQSEQAYAAPSILTVFKPESDKPPGLTDWDLALLKSLYNTDQSNVGQIDDIQYALFKELQAQK